jgi:DNA replication and repair protein RecF
MTSMTASPVRVFVTALQLTDFRNHAALSLSLGPRSVALIGDNGAGKTNILEALSLLSPGRGLRRATMADMARIGGPGTFAVSATAENAYGEIRIGTGTKLGDPSRQIRIDGEPQKSAEVLSEHIRVLWLTPAMDGLFTGSAGDRRRFLDRLVLALDPAHGRRVAAFEAAVTSRNRILEDSRADIAWLDAVEAGLAELAVAVAAARREAIGCLVRLTGADTDPAAPFPAANVYLEGDVETALESASAADVEDWYRRDLSAARSRDRAAGRTLMGPHRADLVVHHAGKGMPAALSSTGEQKALLIGLVLAQARLIAELIGMTPILLLDEVAAHLDAGRREALFDRLAAIGGQTVMTGTDAAPFAGLSGTAAILRISAAEPPEKIVFEVP